VGDNAQSGSDPDLPIDANETTDSSDGLLGGLPGFSSQLSLVSMLGAAVLVAGGRRKD